MAGLRGFLIALANIVLVILVVVIPLLAFFVVGTAQPTWRGEFNPMAGILGAVIAFCVSLPFATVMALFLDIREQLVQLNRGTARSSPPALPPTSAHPMAASPPPPAPPPVAATMSGQPTGAPAPSPPSAPRSTFSAAEVEEMRQWFERSYGKSISPGQAADLLASRAEGRLLAACEELVRQG